MEIKDAKGKSEFKSVCSVFLQAILTQTPTNFARFERLFEIVSTNADDVAIGRDRYRFYQQRGYPLTHSVAEL